MLTLTSTYSRRQLRRLRTLETGRPRRDGRRLPPHPRTSHPFPRHRAPVCTHRVPCTLQREDLVRLLHKLALEAGARIDFNTEVVSIHAPSPCPSSPSSPSSPNAPRPSITLASGETLSADILIGADGARSRVRDVVLGREDAPRAGGLTLYTGIVEGERMLRDPELRPFLLSDEWPMLMGEGRSVSGHSVVRFLSLAFSSFCLSRTRAVRLHGILRMN